MARGMGKTDPRRAKMEMRYGQQKASRILRMVLRWWELNRLLRKKKYTTTKEEANE